MLGEAFNQACNQLESALNLSGSFEQEMNAQVPAQNVQFDMDQVEIAGMSLNQGIQGAQYGQGFSTTPTAQIVSPELQGAIPNGPNTQWMQRAALDQQHNMSQGPGMGGMG